MQVGTAQPVDPADAPPESPKRLQVIEAARALFLAHGYGAVSMDAVARTAGVSKATLYAHFVSKDRLFATIVSERLLSAGLDESLFAVDVPDQRAAIERIGQAALRFMLHERTLAIYRIAMAESVRFPELGRAFYDNGPQIFVARVADWLATRQAAGAVRVVDIATASHHFMALLRSGVFLRASLGLPPPPSDAEIDATVAAAVDTWLRAFGTETP